MLANEESILRQHVLLSIATGQEDARRLFIEPNWQTAACFARVTVGWRPPGQLMNFYPKVNNIFLLLSNRD